MNKITLYKNPLYACFTKRKLAKILSSNNLEVKIAEIRNPDYHFLDKKRVFYQSKITKELFDKKPKDYDTSKYREFNDSCKKHKDVLRRISYLLSKSKMPEYLFSKKESDYKRNALYHLGNTKFILLDIDSFYPNCKFKFVKDFFAKESGLHMSKTVIDSKGLIEKNESDVATSMAKIVTVPVSESKNIVDRIIPQGYPTSTIVSYFSYKEMFDEIYKIALKYDCKFSTYVDDLTFSYSNQNIDCDQLIEEVRFVLGKYGHKISEKKIKIIDIEKKYGENEETILPIITGIIVKRYSARASSKMHSKMNRAYKRYVSMGEPSNSTEYIKKWEYMTVLNGMYSTIEYIEPSSTHASRLNIEKLIKKEKNKYPLDISIKKIKLIKFENKVFDAYKHGTIRDFVNKNKSKLIKNK